MTITRLPMATWILAARAQWRQRLQSQPRFGLDDPALTRFLGMVVGAWLSLVSEKRTFVFLLPALIEGSKTDVCECRFEHYLLDMDRSSARHSDRRGKHGISLLGGPAPECPLRCGKRFATEALLPLVELDQHLHGSLDYQGGRRETLLARHILATWGKPIHPIPCALQPMLIPALLYGW